MRIFFLILQDDNFSISLSWEVLELILRTLTTRFKHFSIEKIFNHQLMERFFRYFIRDSLTETLKYYFFEYSQPIGNLLIKLNDTRNTACHFN